jgi:hypothetical protein
VATLSTGSDSEVGFASLAWSIHNTTHNRDLDRNVQARECLLRSSGNIDDIDFSATTRWTSDEIEAASFAQAKTFK